MKLIMKILFLVLILNTGCVVHCMHSENPLFAAISEGRAAQIKELVACGHSLEFVDHFGRTPLQFAVIVYPERREVITALLESRAEVNTKHTNGFYTPLHAASSEGIATMLLDHGATLESDGFGDTTVHQAAAKQRPAVVKVLLTHVTQAELPVIDEAAPEEKNIEDIVQKKLAVARTLLAQRNVFGENAYAYAERYGSISSGNESELSRLIDGAHIDELTECIRQNARNAWTQRKNK